MLGRIKGVADPGYITQVVFLTFFDFHGNIYRTVVIRLDTVFYDHGVTITQFVVLIYNQLFIGFKVFFNELLGAEQVKELSLFIRFLHHAL